MERKIIEPGMHQVICQKWEELEDGWNRPDGFSLHLTFKALKMHIDYSELTGKPGHYWHPDGLPYYVGVSDSVVAELEEKHGSIEYPSTYEVPGSGGVDGWLPIRTSNRLKQLGSQRRQRRINKHQRQMVGDEMKEYLV